jgi:hypothetical protein
MSDRDNTEAAESDRQKKKLERRLEGIKAVFGPIEEATGIALVDGRTYAIEVGSASFVVHFNIDGYQSDVAMGFQYRSQGGSWNRIGTQGVVGFVYENKPK